MRFRDALRENRVPPRVGDVALRSEPGRLLLETPRHRQRRSLLPTVLQTAAITCALVAAALVFEDGFWAALVLVALGMGLLVLASRLDVREGRRRVVVHFATEVLRLEFLPRSGRPRHHEIPFDEVLSIDLVEELGEGLGIRIWWKDPQGREVTELLVRRATEREGETLHRVWRMLRNAVGLDGVELPD